jgi:hypothetical protein
MLIIKKSFILRGKRGVAPLVWTGTNSPRRFPIRSFGIRNGDESVRDRLTYRCRHSHHAYKKPVGPFYTKTEKAARRYFAHLTIQGSDLPAEEGSCIRFSYQNGFIFVCNKKPRIGRQDVGWKRGADGEEKAVAPFEVILPFMV